MNIHALEYLEDTYPILKGKVAIRDRDTDVTFSELRRRALCVREMLLSRSITRNVPVAVYLPKSAQSIICYTGILYTGNFYVPLDAKSPIERIGHILDTVSPEIIITNSKLKKNLLQLGFSEELVVEYESLDFDLEISEEKIDFAERHFIDTDPAYALFTSGSTGKPKGVVVSHRSIIDYIDWARDRFSVDQNHILGNQSPFFFDQSVFDIYLMMSTGATMVIIPEELFIFPARLLDYLNEVQVNMFFWVPSLLVNIANFNLLEKIEMPYLKKIFFGGEVMSTSHLNYWRKHLPDAMYINMYGPTETTVDSTYYVVEREISDDESVPIGYPCRNTDIIILNEKNQRAAVNENGELCVRGSSLSLGYYNNPEKTAEVFIQNPLNKHYPELIYRTGDIVYLNENNEIIYLCRKDNQIQHMGYRIELGEIEVAVLGLGLFDNACVLYNEVKKEIVLFFSATQKVEVGAIRSQLVQKLPKYMVPSSFIQLDQMPLNPNGKIDRSSLKLKLQQDSVELK
nr:amino acid adenylation domain-containing protein [uncultured Carboxylicivirga sp.]